MPPPIDEPMSKQQRPETRLLLQEYHRGHLNTSLYVTGEAGRGAAPGTLGLSPQRASLFSGAAALLRAAFLPEGFPDSVSSDYLGFQAWDTVQALSSYVRGVLTSQAILRGVGVGQQTSTPLAAVFTFFVRDLAGMLGGILFAYLEGSNFDACAKQWRLFADITNDLGMTVELASPLLPRALFLPTACLGSVARSLTGVAGGATRAALTQHFARRGNAADVSAKEQSQETATTILGMVAGMALTRLLAEAEAWSSSSTAAVAAWVVFLALTALHVVANVAAMRVLVLSSLNMPRLELLVDRYLREGRVLTPRELSTLEDLTPPPFRRLADIVTGASWRRRVRLQYGSRLTSALRAVVGDGDGGGGGGGAESRRQASTSHLAQFLHRQTDRPYLILTASSPVPSSPSPSSTSATAVQPAAPPAASHSHPRVCVHLVLRRGATSPDQLRAFVHARCLMFLITTRGGSTRTAAPSRGAGRGPEGRREGASAGVGGVPQEWGAEEWMAGQYDAFVSGLAAAGWHTDRVALPRPSWTAAWGPAGEIAGGAGAGMRPHTD